MTWVTDSNGTRWVEPVARKKRKSPQALRFASIKAGDQIMTKPPASAYFLVTDRWFDPVAGQRDPVAGDMVALQQISPTGALKGSKRRHTVRGLASQGFLPADMDYVAFCQARAEGIASGVVTGIGAGRRRGGGTKSE